MAVQELNTSRAQQVKVDIFNYDDIPLSAVYTSSSSPIDLTDYKFQFFLYLQDTIVETYELAEGDLLSEFLEKTGDDLNVLNMQAMWQDIRDNTSAKKYRLVQVVTDPNDKKYVHVIYLINAERY